MLNILSVELLKMPGLFLTVGVVLIAFALIFFIVGMKKSKEIKEDEKTEEEAPKNDSTLVTDKVIAKPVVVEKQGEKLEIKTPVVPVAVKKEEPKEEAKEEAKAEPLVLDAATTVEVKKVETPTEVKVETPTEVKVETPVAPVEVKVEAPVEEEKKEVTTVVPTPVTPTPVPAPAEPTVAPTPTPAPAEVTVTPTPVEEKKEETTIVTPAPTPAPAIIEEKEEELI